MTRYLLIAVFVLIGAGRSISGQFDPDGIFLTWKDDPATTMVIDFHTQDDALREPVVDYRIYGEDPWNTASGDTRPFPYTDRIIHRVHLSNLEPASLYEFRFGDDSRIYRFRTMPADPSKGTVRFATGGDTRHRKDWMDRTNRVAMEYDLDFIAWGGDLAYADGMEERVYRWIEWFDSIKETLIDDDGRVVPIIAGIGNHEVRNHYYTRHEGYEQTDAWRKKLAPYYYTLFAFPGQPGYGTLDFGSYLSIILLDTDHSNPIDGIQTEWLHQALEKRKGVKHLFPIYHVTAFPSHRNYEAPFQRRIREHWVPLFEQYNIRVAFENHDHTYKRTHPIRDGKVSEDGVVYIGDGAWGVRTRDVHSVDETWYLKRAESARHAIIVTLHGNECDMVMVDEDGDVIDRFRYMLD